MPAHTFLMRTPTKHFEREVRRVRHLSAVDETTVLPLRWWFRTNAGLAQGISRARAVTQKNQARAVR
jgi:hypothetical protein